MAERPPRPPRRSRLAVALVALALVAAGCSTTATTARTVPPTSAPSARSTAAATSPDPTSAASTSSAANLPPAVSAAPAIPPVSAAASAAGLLDVRTIVPDAIIDLRYATTDNFTHVELYPADARCLVHQTMAAGLTIAAARIRAQGEVLVFWDCYRPHAVQVQMFQIVPNPSWVARPGAYAYSHEAARSVDVTIAQAAAGSCADNVQGHCLLDMGTGFDDFTDRAHAYATSGVTAAEQANRAELRSAMGAGGLAVYSGEWWHFDGPGAAVKRPILAVPVD